MTQKPDDTIRAGGAQPEGAPNVEILADVAQIVLRAKQLILASADAAIAARGRFTIALSGGSTPRPLYRALAEERGIDWSKWWLFWGDERTVPPDHAESNYRLVRETLLDRIPVPPGLVISPTAGEFALLPPEEQALAYATALRDAFGVALPQLDLNLLGMGGDGHTASFFPGGDRLAQALDRASPHRVEAMTAPGAGEPRITLTAPALLGARLTLLHIEGPAKRETLARAQAPGDIAQMPIRLFLRQAERLEIYWTPEGG